MFLKMKACLQDCLFWLKEFLEDLLSISFDFEVFNYFPGQIQIYVFNFFASYFFHFEQLNYAFKINLIMDYSRSRKINYQSSALFEKIYLFSRT